MKRRCATFVLTILAAACTEDAPTHPDLSSGLPVSAAPTANTKGTALVTHNGDAGPGSFRAAVALAGADPAIGSIRFAGDVGTVSLLSTVTFTGGQDLAIDGRGAILDAAGVADDAFVVTGGGSLALAEITVRNAPEDGVYVDVPATAAGRIEIALDRVTIQGNGRYGLHVDDRAGGEPGGADSPASIVLDVRFSHILDNNIDRTDGVFDFDGIRVDEGGEGGIEARVLHSYFLRNRADGIELDEAGPGDVSLFVRQSTFDDNGDQVQQPDDPEDGIDVDEAGPGDLYLDVAQVSSRSNADDGIDMDEDGEGSIFARIVQTDVSGAGNDGLVFTEDEFNQVGDGGIHAVLIGVTATGAGDRGWDSDEFGDGDIRLEITNAHFDDNGSDGIRLEEFDAGSAILLASNITVDRNGDEGLQIEEDGSGDIDITLRNSSLTANVDHGAQLEEQQDGDLWGRFFNARVDNNGDWGFTGEQEAPGSGVLQLRSTDVTGNTSGPVDLEGVTIVE